MSAVWLLALVAFLGVLARWLARSRIGRLGRIVYLDQGPQSPFLAHGAFGLRGKPDAVVKRGHDLVPVEYKSTPLPGPPYASHVLQLLAAGLLVEATYGEYPPYGFLVYGKTHLPIRINMGPDGRRVALQAVSLLRSGRTRPTMVRVNGRCRSCPARLAAACRFH